MDDKFVMMGLGDDRSKYVAEVLGNKTCRKIVDFLADVKEASEKEISEGLKVPMNTVEYNLKKLVKAGLVEKTGNHFWSVKGRKIAMYKLARKHIVISPKIRKPSLDIVKSVLPVIFVGLFLFGAILYSMQTEPEVRESFGDGLLRFNSDVELVEALSEARESGRGSGWFGGIAEGMDMVTMEAAPTKAASGVDYSETNVQVQGVDEADIIKTDGEFVYAIAGGKLIVARAYPADALETLAVVELSEFNANELFIDGDRLLVFGSESYSFDDKRTFAPSEDYWGPAVGTMSIRLYDLSDRSYPELLRVVDFEGNYLTSRKIDSDVYFVVNSYPRAYEGDCVDIVPRYRDGGDEFESVACTDIGYVDGIEVSNFITIASISMIDEDWEIDRETILGSGQNVYASSENLYIAQTSFENGSQMTNVLKFGLDAGDIEYSGSGVVDGHILNQFSMDEYDGYFRIATTIDGYSNNIDTSTNNMYVLDDELGVVGEIEGIAPGESIYSVRFMGGRAYMVTFRHIDPLFVIDLSDPTTPEILGKLKIPGYSDYLHPYDETHLIGIGKEVDASIDADLVHTEGAVYYTAIQGVKIAIFDVSDVENPIEVHKEVIGDRGTESLATSDHKAFLFDKERGLLVVPMTVAELAEGQDKSMQGEYVFQGAYVYDIDLEDGFDLRGRVTHYDGDEDFKKSGYYFRGDSSIKRSLYIDDILYTLSDARLQLNDLGDLDNRIGLLSF
jgi:uncharacterized secreted protein with C-terminal beta-propeller domain